jgi:3-deoxy-D-manno-octulosonate 8-phosphate phosphatase KdsC-like HAD superfamily phosphatase
LGIAPRDATPSALNSANYVTDANGGYGVLLEVVDKLVANKLRI